MGGCLPSFAGDQTEVTDPPKPLRMEAAGAGSFTGGFMPNTPFNRSWAVVPAGFGSDKE